MTKPPTKPKRHVLRVSLRTFFVLLTVGCIWLGWRVEMVRRQRVAAQRVIDEMGGRVYYRIDAGRRAESRSLGWLIGLTQIDLRTVKIVNCAGNNLLTDLSPLTELNTLQILRAHNAPISDLTPLANLKNLVELDLSYTGVSDLTPLDGLTKLEYLDVSNTPVSDLKPLSSLGNLWRLDLENTSVSNLRPLASLKNLKHLTLINTAISEKDLVALEHALPNCLIDSNVRSQK